MAPAQPVPGAGRRQPLRCRIRLRMRRFLRPTLRRPFFFFLRAIHLPRTGGGLFPCQTDFLR